MYLLVTARKGISSLQLAKEIGVTQKTAWFILGRLREACSDPDSIDKLRGIIEIDECFVGGKEGNKHESKKLHAGRGSVGKTAVLGMRERGGRTRAQVITKRNLDFIHGEIHHRWRWGRNSTPMTTSFSTGSTGCFFGMRRSTIARESTRGARRPPIRIRGCVGGSQARTAWCLPPCIGKSICTDTLTSSRGV